MIPDRTASSKCWSRAQIWLAISRLVSLGRKFYCSGMTRNLKYFGFRTALNSRQRSVLRRLACALLILGSVSGIRAEDLVPLTPKLPAPAFAGTPKDAPEGTDVEAPTGKPRAPLMVPKDVKNLAPGSKVTTSDANATPAAIGKITDGDKEAVDTSIVLLRKGTQYVQFDLGAPSEIFAVLFWHAHDSPKVYRGVVVQVSDDPSFAQDVKTLFNNDKANTSGRGVGTDREYYESNEGKLVDAKGVKARYVRLYSHGSTDSALNEYTEVEIYGRPAK